MIRLTENYGNIGNEFADTFKEKNSDLRAQKLLSISSKMFGAYLMIRGGTKSYGAINKLVMGENRVGMLFGGLFRGVLGWDFGEIGHTIRERIDNPKELQAADALRNLFNNATGMGLERGVNYTELLYKYNAQNTIFISRVFKIFSY